MKLHFKEKKIDNHNKYDLILSEEERWVLTQQHPKDADIINDIIAWESARWADMEWGFDKGLSREEKFIWDKELKKEVVILKN